ncbi:hypothetical protein [Rugamonas sp.]|uniref:hypothetical protein n=1 Tax=Rugamonas sp. TaxID=1926287 RepID=UPI0025EED500|nr:hypothetical protein [Rugamonas sp.]
MSFSDDILMAYASGELDEETRRAVEHAMRTDDSVARRVAQQRAMHGGGNTVFGRRVDEAAPRRQTLPHHGANVVQLDAARAHRAAHQHAVRRRGWRRWSWLEWSALAGVLMLGLVAGKFGLGYLQMNWPSELLAAVASATAGALGGGGGGALAVRDGRLGAQGKLEQALNRQLAGGASDDGSVRIGVSFIAGDGAYCRSFTLVGHAQETSGLACRGGEEWHIPVIAQNVKQAPQAGAYRALGSDTPAAVLEAIDQRIAGPELDVTAEQEALRKNWQR